MEIQSVLQNGTTVAVVSGQEVVLSDVTSALDLLVTALYETHSNAIIIPKECICADFFDLSTRIAGEILQKIVTYRMKMAIVGDFSKNITPSLRAFIAECNRGNDIFFLPDVQTATDRLCRE